MEERHRNKKGWLEIDRMHNRTTRANRRKQEEKGALERALEDPVIKQRYLRQAERLFMGPKGRPEHARDLKAIRESYRTPGFSAAVKHYLESYGMPDDWGTLTLLLDLKDDAKTVISAIKALCGLAGAKGPVERKGLKSKLDIMRITARDPDVRDAAEEAFNAINP